MLKALVHAIYNDAITTSHCANVELGISHPDDIMPQALDIIYAIMTNDQ